MYTLVIGVGNPFRGDDAVGIAAAKAIRAAAGGPRRVYVHEGEAAGLIGAWQGAQSVALIDAMSSGASPGSVARFDAIAAPLPPATFRGVSSHTMDIVEAIELARTLDLLPPRLVVYGIEGARYELGDPLSPEAELGIAEVVEEILKSPQS